MKHIFRSFVLAAVTALVLNAHSTAHASVIASNPSIPDSSAPTASEGGNFYVTLSSAPLTNVITYVDLYGPSGQTASIDFTVNDGSGLIPSATVLGIESSLGSFSEYRFNLPSYMTAFSASVVYPFELRNIVDGVFYTGGSNVPFLSNNSSVLVGVVPADPSDTRVYDGPTYQFTIGNSESSPSSVPEIDPASFGSVAALLTGALGLIEQRRRRRGSAIALAA
jgi:hypothetical protein